MKKVTQKGFERFLRKFYPNMKIKEAEINELYQFYVQMESIGQNLIICMNGIRSSIFISEEIDDDNVDYFTSFNIDYSSSIYSNKLIRRYSIEVLLRIMRFKMFDVDLESMMFFENNDPKLWAKRMDFYKSKFKKLCVGKSYIPMTEFLNKLYRVLVILHYDLEIYNSYFSSFAEQLIINNIELYQRVYRNKDENYDESILLSDLYFDTKKADEIISDYELAVMQKEMK